MDVAINCEGTPTIQRNLPEWQYNIVSENLYQLELGEYHTYGIQEITTGCSNIVHDVSVSKNTVEYIVELLNHYKVSPVHLYDVVADMLP